MLNYILPKKFQVSILSDILFDHYRRTIPKNVIDAFLKELLDFDQDGNIVESEYVKFRLETMNVQGHVQVTDLFLPASRNKGLNDKKVTWYAKTEQRDLQEFADWLYYMKNESAASSAASASVSS